MDSAAVVRRAQAGDAAAFEVLVRLHARLVWALVHGMIRDRDWTEDLVQETFLRAWQSLDALKDPAAFKPYLLSIARRLAWRHSEVSRRPVPVPEPPRAPSNDPEEALEQLRAALSRLPERYRLPLTLHFVDGLEYADIARTTGLENGSLRGLLARGLAKLRAELAPWWRTRHEHA